MNTEGTSQDEMHNGREKHHLTTSDASSLFDLKGELYRKKIEQRNRASNHSVPSTSKKSVLTIRKEEKKVQNDESRKRQERIKELEREMEEERQRAQKILEEKSAIYNKLSSGNSLLNEDGQHVEFLVDFDAKKRQMEKEKMEEKKAEAESSGQIEVHFAPNEEQRVYGVSHVNFSAVEKKRQEQMKALLEMSKQTEADRQKRRAALDKREQERIERLNKIRKRKGLPEIVPEPKTPEIPQWDESSLLDIPLPEESKSLAEKKTKFGIREWDRGKVAYSNWISNERDKRDEEFAPPSSYFR